MTVNANRGVCVWFTGLSGAGKTTIAEALFALVRWERPITMLDGDLVREFLSQGLGFSKADRDENIKRISFVAAEVVKHSGFVIVAAISPYNDARAKARQLVGSDKFIEVFVDTDFETCKLRDPKGLYKKVFAGEIQRFTGVDDPYERPTQPDIMIKTEVVPAHDAALIIHDELIRRGLVDCFENPSKRVMVCSECTGDITYDHAHYPLCTRCWARLTNELSAPVPGRRLHIHSIE